jgi:predicted enzyme related to lactoylglutathione lyase
VWNELATRDPDAATGFYDSLLGWSTAPMDPSDAAGYRVVSVQGRVVAGLMPMGPEFPAEIPTHWLTYFAVDDAQATADRCAATGGAVVQGPFPTPVGTMAVLRDPTGAVFAIGAMVNIDDPNEWPA